MSEFIRWNEDAAITYAIEENQLRFWARLDGVVGLELRIEPRSFATRSPVPVPLFNSVLWADLADSEVEDGIDGILAPYEEKGLPTLWWVGPRTHPDDVPERLRKRSFRHHASTPGMAIDLAQKELAPAMPEELRIDEVASAEDAEAYGTTCPAGFSLPPASSVAFAQIAERGIGTAEFRHYVARLGDRPVGTSSLLMESGVAGIYNVTTLPDARGQGVGAALTAFPLRLARERGYHVGILHASDMGRPVYERLGFETRCVIESYVRDVENVPKPSGGS